MGKSKEILPKNNRPLTKSIEDTAQRLGVSTATIRNWVKTKYLEKSKEGNITVESICLFENNVLGKDKLTQRANKSLKDSHDHNEITTRYLNIIELSDVSLDEIGEMYEEELSNSYRNKEGIYYTPYSTVCNLFTVKNNDSLDSVTFLDPCCGSGNFIIRALDLGFKPENIYGYDIDAVAVSLVRKIIYEKTGYITENIKVGDFLQVASMKKLRKFDYIYTNPPWGKKIPKEKRELYKANFSAGASVDTCALFFFACLKSMKDNGELGLLLPEAFFNISSFETVRKAALKLSIRRLIDYDKIFKGLITKAQGIVLVNKPAVSNEKVKCESKKGCFERKLSSFKNNPKLIINLQCKRQDAEVIDYIYSIPHITLEDKSLWGLGIVTGNNKKFVVNEYKDGYIPVYKGSDIHNGKLKKASSYIPSDLSLYQQVPSVELFKAKEKLVYKFISSKLCFYYDNQQVYLLNSANMLIPDESFPVSIKVLAKLLSSDFMNWIFKNVFNTHKILRGDIELLPIHFEHLEGITNFNEADYLNKINIERMSDGSYRVKE